MNKWGVVEISLPVYYFCWMRAKQISKLSDSKKRYYTRYFYKFLTNCIVRKVKHEGDE
jgi:hypothetical protein